VQGSSLSTQAIFSTINLYLGPQDLIDFQTGYSPPAQAITTSIGGHVSDSVCLADNTICFEPNLDVQYMMSTSKVSPTTHWYTDKFFDDWLIDVANSENPPLVFSISYGAEEQKVADFNPDILDAFDTQAAKLGVMGVTIVASSGMFIFVYLYIYLY
jgi:hypothetical protein